MPYYKLRINSSAFEDIVVKAKNKKEAIEKAERKYRHDECPEFCEFLDLEDGDIESCEDD